MSENKPTFGGANTTIGGIILAIIAAVMYFGNGGSINLSPSDDSENTRTVTADDENEQSDDNANDNSTTEFVGLTDYLPTSTTGQIIQHTYYTLSYSAEKQQPEWVAYELTRDRVLKSTAHRDNLRFKVDPNLDEDEAVKNSDYTRTGYDRGHLVPAQDMAFSEDAMAETFYMTNVSPQDKDFNRGVWKSLELLVRDWAANFDHIYVITGPVLTSRAKARFKNKSNIPVPASFYKIILDFHGKDIKAIAFWLKNEKSDAPLVAFATSINDIEDMTGIDFFPKLPDDLEEELESSVDISDWALTRDAYSVSLDTSWLSTAVQKEEQ